MKAPVLVENEDASGINKEWLAEIIEGPVPEGILGIDVSLAVNWEGDPITWVHIVYDDIIDLNSRKSTPLVDTMKIRAYMHDHYPSRAVLIRHINKRKLSE